MRIKQLEKFSTLCAAADKVGLKLTESGAPVGERRWFALRNQAGKIVKESVDLRVIETAIKNVNSDGIQPKV